MRLGLILRFNGHLDGQTASGKDLCPEHLFLSKTLVQQIGYNPQIQLSYFH